MLDSDQWRLVPDGSTLAVKVSSTVQGACQSSARLVVDGTEREQWSNADLVQGKSVTVRSPHIFTVDLNLFFLDTATATVDATITDPMGGAFGTPYSESASGTKGDSESTEFDAISAV